MANVTKGSGPWAIDTASATAITTDVIAIDQIVWVPGTSGAAGDECKVTDNSATPIVLFDEFASGASEDVFPQKMNRRQPINGLIVPTLAHGIVYIHLA